mmetsp:Transcript_81346/g.217543  ORF Transcript_81346/g.217543 Transcript_81346/m.217543 type:complete len:103 (-) Transcript_81346:677-985(-)
MGTQTSRYSAEFDQPAEPQFPALHDQRCLEFAPRLAPEAEYREQLARCGRSHVLQNPPTGLCQAEQCLVFLEPIELPQGPVLPARTVVAPHWVHLQTYRTSI